MLGSVFFFQPLGQLAATLVALVVTASFKSSLTAGFQSSATENSSSDLYTYNCYQDQHCVRTVDMMWRIVIGLGAVPPVLALWFRLAILESPRYTADVLNENIKAYEHIHWMGLGDNIDWKQSPNAVPDSSVIQPSLRGHATGPEGHENGGPTAHGAFVGPSAGVPNENATDPDEKGHFLFEYENIKDYYWTRGHGWTLFACSLCWFCVDLPF
jgi:MFS transporter, PHS family, inorganic phosphate transporter